MKGFITIWLWSAYPVAEPVGLREIRICNYRVDVPACSFFRDSGHRFKYNTYGQNIVDFLERNIFRLHFFPDREYRFWPSVYVEINSGLRQFLNYGKTELVNKRDIFLFTVLHL